MNAPSQERLPSVLPSNRVSRRYGFGAAEPTATFGFKAPAASFTIKSSTLNTVTVLALIPHSGSSRRTSWMIV
jgi:hypothetical protein